MLLRVKDDWHIVDAADKLDLAKFKLDVAKLQVKVDPPAEWAQIFDEAWRINRDYFYDPGYPRRRLAGDAHEVRRRSCRTSRRATT